MENDSNSIPYDLDKLIHDLIRKQIAQDAEIKLLAVTMKTFLKTHIGKEAAKLFWDDYVKHLEHVKEEAYRDNPFVIASLNKMAAEEFKGLGIHFESGPENSGD